MNIAIIGGGISGMLAAYLLHTEHQVTVFEANDYIGGHTHTIPVICDDQTYNVDTGFIVFNDWTYPNFTKLLHQLGVVSQPSSMSFSVRCEKTGLEYNGATLNTLFAQRRNLFRLSFHRMWRDILRFNHAVKALMSPSSYSTSTATSMNLILINILAFQLGWFACVLGAAQGFLWAGPTVVALSLALHLAFAKNRMEEALLFIVAGMVGFLLDSIQAAMGVFFFATAGVMPEWSPPWLSPPWMVALWPNFATTFHVSSSWLTGRYALAASLGAVDGPLRYYAGARLGALSFPEELAASLLVVGLVWAIAMPTLLWAAKRR